MAITNINENLRFDDATRGLSSQKIPHKTITLGVAATFCLTTLLEAKGNIVSQETLITEGWRRHGLEVSPGNVRQVVSQIRRALMSLKESPDMLVTVPKLGYRFEVPVSAVNNPTGGVAAKEEQASSLPDSPIPSLAPRPITSTTRRPGIPPRLGLALGINIALAAGFFYWTLFYPVPQANYTLVDTAPWPNAHLMVENSLRKDHPYITHSLALLKQSPAFAEEQKTLPWVYLNGTMNKKVHSFFLCSQVITAPQAYCKSRIFSEE